MDMHGAYKQPRFFYTMFRSQAQTYYKKKLKTYNSGSMHMHVSIWLGIVLGFFYINSYCLNEIEKWKLV